MSDDVTERLDRIERSLQKLSMQMITLIRMRLDDRARPDLWHYIARLSDGHTELGEITAGTSGEAYVQALSEVEGRWPGTLVSTLEVIPSTETHPVQDESRS